MKIAKYILLPAFMLAVFASNGWAQNEKKKKLRKNNKKIEGKEQVTESGLKYTITEAAKKGVRPQKGDIVEVHYVGKFLNDTVFDSSYKRGEPISFPLGEGKVIKGWDEGISYLVTGDKAIFIIPAELAYGSRGAGRIIPPNTPLKFEVELISVKKPQKPFNTAGKDTLTFPSGLKMIKIKETEGATPETGETVIVHYSGYLLDGMKKFDSSYDRGKPFEFKLGKGQVIKGWDEAFAHMRKGEKARLIIPSNLGYGANGAGGVIPPNATLIFDVELLGIK